MKDIDIFLSGLTWNNVKNGGVTFVYTELEF